MLSNYWNDYLSITYHNAAEDEVYDTDYEAPGFNGVFVGAGANLRRLHNILGADDDDADEDVVSDDSDAVQ